MEKSPIKSGFFGDIYFAYPFWLGRRMFMLFYCPAPFYAA